MPTTADSRGAESPRSLSRADRRAALQTDGPRVTVPRTVHRDSGLARAQRLLTTMSLTVIVLTVLAIAALFVLPVAGVPASAFRSGFLQFVAVFPTPGLALGLLLAIAAITVRAIKVARTAR